jgi:hypothetical protein
MACRPHWRMLTKSTSLVAPYRHPQEKRLSTRRGAVESHVTRVSESTRVAHLRSWRSIKHSTRLLTTLPANRQCGNCRSAWDLGASFMSPGEVKTEHTKFLHLAAAAINVFVSSGDAGSNADTGHNPTRPLQAEYQASDPAVIGVGGSSLLSMPRYEPAPNRMDCKRRSGKQIFLSHDLASWVGVPAGTSALCPMFARLPIRMQELCCFLAVERSA